MRFNIYPLKLQEYIKENKVIPRKIRKNEHLKIFHKYWLGDYNCVVKINDIFTVKGVEYYIIKFGNFYACIDHPINYKYCYEILHNKDNIENINIINSDKCFTGAEIKYWFLINNIDFNDDLYYGFWSFLNPNSNNLLVDNKYYKVLYDNSKRKKCQITIDKC